MLRNPVAQTKLVRDDAAEAAVKAEADALIAEAETKLATAEDLNNAAENLNNVAKVLNEMIYNTNALFERLFNYAQNTDAKYAAKMDNVMAKIQAYINRMADVRDGFTAKFLSEVGSSDDWGGGYFAMVSGIWSDAGGGFSTGPSNMLPPIDNPFLPMGAFPFAISPAVWAEIEHVLNMPGASISMEQYAALAFSFGHMVSLGDKEKFLNLLADEVDLFRAVPHDTRTFIVCPIKIAGIQIFLDIGIASTLENQMHLRLGNLPYEHLNATRHRLIRNSALLTAVAELTSSSSSIPMEPLGLNNVIQIYEIFLGGNNGLPFSLSPWDADGGWATLTTRTTQYTHARPSALFRPDGTDVEINFSQVLGGSEVFPKMWDILHEELSVRYVYNPSRNIATGVISFGLGTASVALPPPYSFVTSLLDLGLTIYSTAHGWAEGVAQAVAMHNEVFSVVNNAELAVFHHVFGVEAVTVWHVGKDPYLVSRPAPNSRDNLDRLNHYLPNDLAVYWGDFSQNPVSAALDKFLNELSVIQRGHLIGNPIN